MLFKYKGLDKSGKTVKGTLDASSLDDAKNKLKSRKIYYSYIDKTSQFKFDSFSRKLMPDALLSGMSKELSSYLNSGMTILVGLKLMEKQHSKEKKYNSFLNTTRTMVDEGKSLYVALNTQKIYELPDFFLQSLNVAGQSGKMGEVLKSMSTFFSGQSKVKKEVSNAMIYPLFIFIVAFAMTAFLVSFVVPKIVGVFEDTHKKLPGITKFVIDASNFLTTHYMVIIIGLIGIILLFKLLYAKIYALRYMIAGILLKVPPFGMLIHNHELGRFSYILALMLSSGVSYAQAVQLASTTFNNEALKATFAASSQKVMEGNKLSNALYSTKGFKPNRNFLQSLALGEESSQVAPILFNLAEYYEEENSQRLASLLKLMEPIMMLVIGAVVGVIVIAMMLPIFTMSAGI